MDLNNRGFISQAITVVSGAVYQLKITEVSGSAYVAVGNSPTGTTFLGQALATGENTFYFVPTDTSVYVNVRGVADGTQLIDNISVREINPLSVSIAMDGRMTYADEDGLTAEMFRWQANSSNTLRHLLYTTGAETGEINLFQINGGNSVNTSHSKDYLPNVLTPINYAAVHASTSLNVGKDGLAATRGTTSIGLPDLSSSNARIAYNYMGTIDTVRIWDRDIGDTGLVEATNPSLEPSLSLTFEGVWY